MCSNLLLRIREAHPLKQGLKQIISSNNHICGNNSRGTSTKTRIETNSSLHPARQLFHSRGTSTKTRIETPKTQYPCYFRLPIREAHPLKQGLKLGNCRRQNGIICIREAHPLKQGLKHHKKWTNKNRYGNSRGTSTKTRIETFQKPTYP